MALALFLLEVNTANSLAKQRVFRDRLNPLDAYNDTDFISRYRITRGIFIQLHEKIVVSPLRYKIRSHSIPTLTQLAVSLQLYIDYGKWQSIKYRLDVIRPWVSISVFRGFTTPT